MNREEESQEDLRCMARLKAGDDAALGEIMARWRQPLMAFILRYTGHEADALDLAQETFVRVFESCGRYEPRSKFSTWLFAIAANLCRNLARWRERHPSVALHDPGGDDAGLESSQPAPGDTPADSAERNDLASAIRQHVQALPHDLRTVVLLFEYHDLGYEEIAATLGCTPKAVETRLYRARQILRAGLAPWHRA